MHRLQHSLLSLATLATCLLAATLALFAGGAGTAAARASHAARQANAGSFARQCADPSYPAVRNPANPLMLATTPPADDPLRGANFFVAGPARGTAAGAIAQLLGFGRGEKLSSGQPLANFSDAVSWTSFARYVDAKLPSQPAGVRHQIQLLEKIAQEPTPLRVSNSSQGGSPAGVYTQTRKLFCSVLQADPGTVPLISTYFLHAELGGCSSTAQIMANAPRFRAQVDAMARAIGRRPVVLLLELDYVGSSRCMADRGSLGAWAKMMRYESSVMEALPHTVVYMEGGYSDSNNAAYAARLLNAAGVQGVQGFFTNDTHMQWTANELRYAKAVSARTGGAHFIINTATNGRGPVLNAHPATEGVEDLCNPPARGLGIPDTTQPGLNPHLDALLWTAPPGNSSGPCNGGTPNGSFDVARAEMLAANANDQLGPGTPSRPY